MASKQDLSLFQVSGEPYDIGYRLGELARPVFADYMEQSSAWRAVRRWRDDPFVQKLRDAASLDEALHILRGTPAASGFHHTLGCAGDERTLSIEASAQRCSVQTVSTIAGHANHLIHPGCQAEAQIVTTSSRDRQARVDALLSTFAGPVKPAALLDVLQDRAPSGLPIYRDDPLDPDDENTLATALFELDSTGVSMKVYRQGQCVFDTFIVRISPAQTGA